MTTKRKTILKAMAFASCTTMDDLVMTTGLARKNLQDNVKATMNEGLCERIRDDVTGLPAYRLTPKGRAWLESDKDNSKTQLFGNSVQLKKNDSVKPPPAVGTNTGSKDTGTIVDGGDLRADPLPVGNAVSAPPKPDNLPVAACADDLKKKHDVACQTIRELTAIVEEQAATIKRRNEQLLKANREQHVSKPDELPPTRYIVAEEYLVVDTEEEAHVVALDLAKEIPINTPVIVFSSHKARELRINWRDA